MDFFEKNKQAYPFISEVRVGEKLQNITSAASNSATEVTLLMMLLTGIKSLRLVKTRYRQRFLFELGRVGHKTT